MAPCAVRHRAAVYLGRTRRVCPYGAHDPESLRTPKAPGTATEAGTSPAFRTRWILRLAACPQELPLLWTRRLVRTDCRPDMHLDRPPDPASRLRASQGMRAGVYRPCPAAPGRSIRNPRSFRPGIVAATATRSTTRK